MSKRDKLRDAPERRSLSLSDFEVRTAGDNLVLDGYASVFNTPYQVLGGPPFGWNETVSPRAFDKTLDESPDLHLLINHEGMPLARTKSGTLQLSTDRKGLRVKAPNLDRRDPDVQRLEVKMSRGDMDEMSFAFRTKADSWTNDESDRQLDEVSIHKGDVSVVNFGASPTTSAQMNSLTTVLEYLDVAEVSALAAELRGESGDVELLRRGRDVLDEMIASLVPKPRARKLTLSDARKVFDGALDLQRRGAVPPHHTATVDTPWDGPAAVARLKDGDEEAFRKCFAWFETGADLSKKASWKFPHHEVSENGVPGAANLAGCRNGLSRLPNAKIPDSDRAGVQKHLQAHLDSADN